MVDALGNAVGFVLTGGHQADCTQLPALLDGLPQSPGKVVADKAYDTNKVLAAIACHQAEAVIPPKANRLDQRPYDENLYADRNKVAR
ncbi:MAG: transposase [Janthinobacterium lividum]